MVEHHNFGEGHIVFDSKNSVLKSHICVVWNTCFGDEFFVLV